MPFASAIPGAQIAALANANTLEWQLTGSLQIAYHLGVLYSRSAGLQVQDEAAGLVVAMLDPQPGEAILDACAAPGGKTLFISARMKNKVWPALLLMDLPLQIPSSVLIASSGFALQNLMHSRHHWSGTKVIHCLED